MNKKFNLIVFLIICTLNSLKEAIGLPSSFGSLLTLLVILPSMYYCELVHKKWKLNSYLKGLDIFLLVVTVYGVLSILEGRNLKTEADNSVVSYKFLLIHYLSLLPIYLFYYYGRLGLITDKIIKTVFLIFFLVGVFNYMANNMRVSDLKEADNVVNNMSYSFVSLIPTLFLAKWKDWIKFTFVIILFMIVLFGMKRGAILIAGVLLVLYIYRQSKIMIRRNIGKVTILVGAMLFVIIRYFFYLYNTNLFFQYRVIETIEGNSSGRDEIYLNYFNYFWNGTTPINFLFGQGAFATVEIFGQYAHNDWLEIAINMGVIGVFFYLLYWIYFYKEWKSFHKGIVKDVFLGVLIAFLLRSLFSMSIYSVSFDVALCIGYCLAYKSSNSYKEIVSLKKQKL